MAILFALVGAERAYFGQKDAQQVMVIDRMAADLALPTRVVPCPTVRERRRAGALVAQRPPLGRGASRRSRAVASALGRRDAWAAGERSAVVLRGLMEEVIATEPLAAVEYVSCADALTLRELERVEGPALLSLAVRFGTTRLIDNVPTRAGGLTMRIAAAQAHPVWGRPGPGRRARGRLDRAGGRG